MKKYLLFVYIAFVCIGLASSANVSAAETTGIAQLAQCSGPDCSACNLVYMANGLITWLIGILCIIFAVILAIAGVKLVTSGGNASALDAAKSSFTNAIIGFLIVLAAWLIVDTIMRGLIGNEGRLDNGGEVSGWLFWSEVTCQTQTEPDPYVQWEGRIASSLQSVGDWAPDVGGVLTSPCSITGYSGATPVYDCSAQMTECSRMGGGLPAESTDGRSVICTPDPDVAGGGTPGVGGGANCPAAAESQMVTIPGTSYKARPGVSQSFVNMRAAAAAEGITLTVVSGWRSEATQVDIWNNHNCSGNSCSGIVARPCSLSGTGSNHNQGEALDLSLSNPSPTLTWLMANAGRFGFYNTLPRDRVHWSLSGG